MAARCTATTKRGKPCKCWAVRDTTPPRCVAHGGAVRRPGGAPPGDTGAATRGVHAQPNQPTGIAQQITDLDQRIARLGAYIDTHTGDLDTNDLIRLLDLHSKMIGRVTRVRQARLRMEGETDEGLTAAINQALDQISDEWGITL